MADDISILLVGSNSFPMLSRLINIDEKRKYYVHCFNVLDYKLPAKKENTDQRQYKAELRRAFRLLKETDTTVDHLDLLRENDYLNLDDLDLEVYNFLHQVFANQPDYNSAYKFLSGDLSKENIRLSPLIDNPVDIVIHSPKKLAPIRYYQERNELLKIDNREFFEKYQSLVSEDDLDLFVSNELSKIQLNQRSEDYLQKSKFLVILISDIISLAIFAKMKDILEKLHDLPLPVILMWPPELTNLQNFAEKDIFELLGFGNSLDKLVDTLSKYIDYIVTANKAKSLGEILLETGYQVENNQLPDPINTTNGELEKFLLSLNQQEE